MSRPAMWMIAAALFLAGPAAATEPAAMPPTDVSLLNETPNYAAALVNQWSGQDVPPPYRSTAEATEHYGLLRDTQAPQPVTLQQALALALANNTDLRIQRLGPLGARASVRSAQSIFDPTVSADVSFDRSVQPAGSALAGALTTQGHNLNAGGGLRKTLLTGGQLSFSWRNNRFVSNSSFAGLVPQYTTTFSASLNQPLLRDFGWRFSTLLVRVARTGETASIYQYEAVVASIVQQVETAYWVLVQAKETVAVQEQGLALANEVLRQNEGKFKVGALPQSAVLEAKSEVARRQANLIQAQNALVLSRDNLRAIINFRPEGSDALLMVEPADRPTVETREFDLDRSLATALENRPELAAATLDVEGKGMMLKVAENQLLPRVNLTGSIGTNGLGGTAVPLQDFRTGQTILSPFGGSYGTTLDRSVDGRYYSYSAGVTFEIPLGNAQARADYAAAQIDAETARHNLAKQQESVTLEVKTAVTNLLSDLKSIEATRIARSLAEDNVRDQKARYDVGLATTKDLLDFQDRLTQAMAAEVQALTTYNTHLTELRRVEGTLLSQRNIVVDRGEEDATPWWARF